MKTTLDCFNLIVGRAIESIYEVTNFELLSTSKVFRGHITLVLLPLVKIIKKPLKQIGKEIGEYVKKNLVIVHSFHLLRGFLNFECCEEFYYDLLKKISKETFLIKMSEEETFMIEYSSPNTNKPLHLGHIRNHLLGNSISEIFKAFGHNVIKIQILNDRGIHICKSMLGWKIFSCGETPDKSKGDHLVGKYYVAFENAYKREVEYLCAKGYKKTSSEKQAPIIQAVRKLLFLWERGNAKTWNLWNKMNKWVLEGIEQTYCQLGIKFDETQYESKTYLLGKTIIEEGLKKGVFLKKEDGSVWVDLNNQGLDEKLLLRADGTAVYITQDLGTAVERFELYSIKSLIYIVGEEQEYHFKVLFFILKRLGYIWADKLFHLSYGMINLPSGKMKSREGSIIDADNLIDEMHKLAQFITYQKEQRSIGIGALKYHLLKINPKQQILFDTKSSIDVNSNTGSYIQYTYVRISSLYRRAFSQTHWRDWKNSMMRYSIIGRYEKSLLKIIENYPEALRLAQKRLIPSIIANLAYNLSKSFNDFYQNVCIINTKTKYDFIFRLFLSKECGKILINSMKLLGINIPERL